jgi:hypothetical protein
MLKIHKILLVFCFTLINLQLAYSQDFSDLGVIKDVVEDKELPVNKSTSEQEDDAIFLAPEVFTGKQRSISEDEPKPSIFHNRIVADLSFRDNYKSKNINNQFADTDANIRLISSIDISKNLELNSFMRLGRFDTLRQDSRRSSSDHGGGDRTLENPDIIIGELNLKYSYLNSAIIAGKFSGNFGSAWRWNRGIWIHKIPAQYSLNNKLGFVGVHKVGDAKTVGLYNLSLSIFTNDHTGLDQTLFRKIKVESSPRYKAGDTKKLDSFSLASDINFDFADGEKLSYHLAYSSLDINSNNLNINPSRIAKQKGLVFGIDYIMPIKKYLDFKNILEYAKIENIDGDSDVADHYFSSNFILTFDKKYSLLFGNSNHQRKKYIGNSFHENTTETNIGYEFTANDFFDRLILQAGYQYSTSQTVTQQKQRFSSIGCLLRYYKNF